MRLESKITLQTVIPRLLVFAVLGHLSTQTLRAAPSIVSVTPNSGQQGQTLASVAIIGQNTNFVQGRRWPTSAPELSSTVSR